MNMLLVVLIAALTHLTEGALEGGLRIKYGPGPNTFLNISRTVAEAKASGWNLTCRPRHPAPHLPQLIMYCDPEHIICALYDDLENVAGMQIAIPDSKFKNVLGWEKRGYQKWFTCVKGQHILMWAIQQYFVSTEYMQRNITERIALRNPCRLLQEKAVWITGFDREILKVSTDKDALDLGFTKQRCYPTMGQHYFYNMSSTSECTTDKTLSWFIMTMDSKVIATGFYLYGFLPLGVTDVFERPTVEIVRNSILSNAPDCVYDLINSPGIITLHIYYTNTPLLTTC